MKSRSHIGFWLLVFLCAIFVVPYFVRGVEMRARLEHEVAAIQHALGSRIGSGVVEKANAVYSATVVASGLRTAMDDLKHTQQDQELAQRIGTTILAEAAMGIDSYLQALSMQLYAVILRGTVVLMWVLMLAPFAGAVLIDGYATRAKKFENLGFQNPTAFALGIHVVVVVSAIPFLYIVAPFSISPLFMPYWAVAAALPLSFAIQHMQPVLTR
ncbi:MAG: DUF4400 domain-containing protein [Burkholderiales bacterium]|nr:DUF4400 domain-containing protein [Burkholderiales bacterium]